MMSNLRQWAEVRKQLMAQASEKVKDDFKEFFSQNPEVTAIGIVGYTPFFNDGDPCYYSIKSVCFAIPSMTTDEEDQEEEDYYTRAFKGNGKMYEVDYDVDSWYRYTPSTPEALRGVITNCHQLQKDIKSGSELIKAAFGDHVAVLVNRENIVITEFNHA